ncbi:SRPBCC family protein [Streptomyces sp. Amel2xC10]|uniref:SRPBCC family protein n=1 Tax=Streptomyces sp. Amel2xC10 TaxID=1305826 RepID=UPI000A09031E|nr:SRPBCC domain-containing protein [Streptomyces sp. Amel2xC10]SMF71675.1 Carbon monoxide dehydrogenase subunit G [Streptomyces sp. Amel2xC10]
MEQEVFVPVPARRLRAALADPAQVARAVPGLQQDAGTEPVAGRLKVRVAGHTITYRGTARITAREDGAYAVEGDATEVRGSGAVKLALVVRPRDTDGGTTLRFEGTASADGRVAELPQDAVIAAVARILNRFAENLGAENSGAGSSGVEVAAEESPAVEPTETAAADEPTESADEPTEPTEPTELAESAEPAESPDAEAGAGAGADAGADAVEDPEAPAEPSAEVPTEPSAEVPTEPPAEAAHARRTMIGRSAEEVDHAPPRGRYAPVPAPQTIAQNSTLRWAAPAAALVVASAIVVGRALRRRR